MAKTLNRGRLTKPAEERLRARIRRALAQVQRAPRSAASTFEDEVLRLIKEYGAAPEGLKEKVYRSGERRLLREFRSRSKAA
jgi:hypothetical protein